MKIGCKNELHSLVSSLRTLLSDEGVSLKTSRAQELLSETFGYKSANGLLGDVPINLRVTEEAASKLCELLRSRHDANSDDYSYLLKILERRHESYSTIYESDKNCYPAQLPDHTNYWYLTQAGWIPWSQVDFTKTRVELGIYKVVSSFSSGPLIPGEGPFLCYARPVWTADIASFEIEIEADRLEREYGEMPEKSRMFPDERYSMNRTATVS